MARGNGSGKGFESRSRVVVELDDGRRHRAWAYVLAVALPKSAREIRKGVYHKRRPAGRAA